MREVTQADLFDWLPAHAGAGAVATSLPDPAELDTDPDEYLASWLPAAADACLAASAGPTVFLQTDRRHDGRWLSKAHVLQAAAQRHHAPLLWHKIVLRRPAGSTDIHRPGYSHLLAFGPGTPGTATPDVLRPSRALWANGAPLDAALAVARYLAAQGATAILNPACGTGALLATAELCGLDAYGCDTDAECVQTARRLGLRPREVTA